MGDRRAELMGEGLLFFANCFLAFVPAVVTLTARPR